MQYETGQNLKIYPENSAESEEKALKCIGFDKEQIIEFESEGLLPFPTPIKVNSLLRKFIDLQGPIKKPQLKSLAEKVKDSQLRSE